MAELFVFFVGVVFLIILIFIFRLFGAWMFRIDEVIKELKEIKHYIRKGNETKPNE